MKHSFRGNNLLKNVSGDGSMCQLTAVCGQIYSGSVLIRQGNTREEKRFFFFLFFFSSALRVCYLPRGGDTSKEQGDVAKGTEGEPEASLFTRYFSSV